MASVMTALMTATITAATTAAMTAKKIVAITNQDQAELSTKELWLVIFQNNRFLSIHCHC